MSPDPNRIVVVLGSKGQITVYADDYRHVEVVVLDFDSDRVTEEDMESNEVVRLSNGDFARAYDEEACDIRKIGKNAHVKTAYEHVLQNKRCPNCDRKLKFFMHNCKTTTQRELHGCPVCEDECVYCN